MVKEISQILHYSMLFLGMLFLTFPVINGKCLTYNCSIYLVFFLSFAASYLFHKLLDNKNVPEIYKLLVDVALWLNILGELYFYYNFQYYERILHLATPVLITLIVFAYFKKNLKQDKLVIFLTVMGGLALFEIFEYLIFTFTKYPLMGTVTSSGQVLMSPLDDTFLDMILGMISSITTILLYKPSPPIDIYREIRIQNTAGV